MAVPLGNYTNFSWAIFSLFGWIVPQVSMEIGEYQRAINKSILWSTEDGELLAAGRRTIRRASIFANFVALAFYAGGATGVALTTKNLEPRMVSIIIGLSHLVGAIFLFALSWYFPEWLEVYHVRARRSVLTSVTITRSMRALRFNAIWSVLRQHLCVYFFFLPFCCGARKGLISIAMVLGIALGLVIEALIYIGKERLKTGKKRMRLIFAVISIVVICSGVLFAYGCDYINYVWGNKDKDNETTVMVSAFFAWLVVGAIIHVLLWRLTKGHVKEMLEGSGVKSVRQLQKSTKYKNPVGEALVTGAQTAVDKVKDKAGKGAPVVNNEGGTDASIIDVGSQQPQDEGQDEEEGPASQRVVGFADDGGAEDDEEEEPPASPKVVGFADDGAGIEVGEKTEEAQDPPERAPGAGKGEGEEGDEEGAVFTEEEEKVEVEVEVEVENEDPTYCELCKMKCCCIRCGGDARCPWTDPDLTPVEKCGCCTKWTIWAVLSIFALFLTIVNSGATEQQDVTRANLPLVQEKLYKVPDWMMGKVCAYDGDGSTGSLNENSTIRTFPTKEEANAAGYLVLHCGKCGHCSTYPNVKYQYTTRNFLAEASRKCAMTSFIEGSGKEYTKRCHMAEPINFDYDCAVCWMETAHCAMEYCSFIGIQSFFINTFTNLAVTPDDVTGATCNEANCEAWEYPNNFADCSGASRRKQNIQNTIRRPEHQQCQIVEVDWAVLFPGQ